MAAPANAQSASKTWELSLYELHRTPQVWGGGGGGGNTHTHTHTRGGEGRGTHLEGGGTGDTEAWQP